MAKKGNKKRTYKSVADQVNPVDYGFKLDVSDMNDGTIEHLYSLGFEDNCIDIRLVKDAEGDTIEEPLYYLFIDNGPESGGCVTLNDINTFTDIMTLYSILTGNQLTRK